MASMKKKEGILKFANRILQLASVLKAMDVEISESEKAMALLNGLPEEYKSIITALDALDSEETELSWEHVKGRLLQEEQRINMRAKSAIEKSETQALVSQSEYTTGNCKNCARAKTRPKCDHCGKLGHISTKCWIKFPQSETC